VTHILLVDDDPGMRRVMTIVLQRGGFTVESAGSLQDARAAVGPFQAIVADVNLPNGDGRHLRESYPGVPMLVISGAPVDDPVEVTNGTLPFLAKPFHPQTLTAAVRALVTPGGMP
jgi:DNA-binding response OmpR family regulator